MELKIKFIGTYLNFGSKKHKLFGSGLGYHAYVSVVNRTYFSSTTSRLCRSYTCIWLRNRDKKFDKELQNVFY